MQADEARERGQHLLELASNCWDREWDANIPAQEIFLAHVAALLARHALEARLDEAKWWQTMKCGTQRHNPEYCICCKRIAELERAIRSLAERASKGAGGGQ